MLPEDNILFFHLLDIQVRNLRTQTRPGERQLEIRLVAASYAGSPAILPSGTQQNRGPQAGLLVLGDLAGKKLFLNPILNITLILNTH